MRRFRKDEPHSLRLEYIGVDHDHYGHGAHHDHNPLLRRYQYNPLQVTVSLPH